MALLILAKSFVVPVIYLDYELNKQFIINNYCVNKSRPQLHCDEKCYLAKKLQAEEQKEQESQRNAFIKAEITTAYCESIAQFKIPNYFIQKSFVNFDYQNLYAHLLATGVFHPPCLV
jgi:hypothetical protein